jgi:hypothetical protein
MKRTSVALGILGLVWAVAMPAANAAVLLDENFNDGKFEGVMGIYKQGLAAGLVDVDGNPAPGFNIRQLDIVDGIPTLAEPGTAITNGVLDWGNGDGISAEPDPTIAHPILLLTGDPTWKDIAIQHRFFSLDQVTGVAALVLRATPKTKVEDPNSWYEFRYSSDNSEVLLSQQEVASGLTAPEGEAGEPYGTNLRILKVVNNKWTLLKELNMPEGGGDIPSIMNNGAHHPVNGGTGAVMRFVAKGTLLQGFIGLPGQQLKLVLEANDSELTQGRVGFHTFEWRPIGDDVRIEDAP